MNCCKVTTISLFWHAFSVNLPCIFINRTQPKVLRGLQNVYLVWSGLPSPSFQSLAGRHRILEVFSYGVQCFCWSWDYVGVSVSEHSGFWDLWGPSAPITSTTACIPRVMSWRLVSQCTRRVQDADFAYNLLCIMQPTCWMIHWASMLLWAHYVAYWLSSWCPFPLHGGFLLVFGLV